MESNLWLDRIWAKITITVTIGMNKLTISNLFIIQGDSELFYIFLLIQSSFDQTKLIVISRKLNYPAFFV